jgi:hypothetical protein
MENNFLCEVEIFTVIYVEPIATRTYSVQFSCPVLYGKVRDSCGI